MSIFKRFVSYYRPYRHLFYLDCLCAMVLCIIDLTFRRSSGGCRQGAFRQCRVHYEGPAVAAAALLLWYLLRPCASSM